MTDTPAPGVPPQRPSDLPAPRRRYTQEMELLASELAYSERYNLLINSVVPRPIAWVSSISSAGQPNLAPFSFFNCVCGDPPLLAFAPGLRAPREAAGKNGQPKDTLRNIRETGEFVISLVTWDLREPMNVTSGEYDPTVNEFDAARVTPSASRLVRPARVAESPVSFECRLHQILDFNPSPRGGSLVIGEIVAIHIDDRVVRDGKLDRDALDLIGRMGGVQYTRTRDRFDMVRPKVG